MPSPHAIRKDLLNVLEAVISEACASPELNAVWAEPPISLPPNITVTHLPVAPLPEFGETVPAFGQQWPEAKVNSMHNPYIVVVFEGEADIRVGTTDRVARETKAKSEWTRSGVHVLHVPSPTFLYFPPGVPYSDGSMPHWEKPEPLPKQTRLLWIFLMPTGALCHTCTSRGRRHKSEYSLLIKDESVPVIGRLIEEELQHRPFDHQAIVKNHLTSLLLRLRRRLMLDAPLVGNTSYLRKHPLPNQALHKTTKDSADRIIATADEFIQTYLNEPLTLPQIAAHCDVSPSYLNQVFNKTLQISTKRYVNRQRVRAACQILEDENTPVKEIARLVGFTQSSHFCQVFQELQQISPHQYRQRARAQASAAPPEVQPLGVEPPNQP